MQSIQVIIVSFALACASLPIKAAELVSLSSSPSKATNTQDKPVGGELDLRALAQERPLERDLKQTESHSYRITMASGEHLYVLVNQRGIDVLLKLFGPDDKLLTAVNDQPNIQEVELFLLSRQLPVPTSWKFKEQPAEPTGAMKSAWRYWILQLRMERFGSLLRGLMRRLSICVSKGTETQNERRPKSITKRSRYGGRSATT